MELKRFGLKEFRSVTEILSSSIYLAGHQSISDHFQDKILALLLSVPVKESFAFLI